jgi:hypothetical protein
MKQGIIIGCIAVLLSGCRSPMNLAKAEYNASPATTYPPVTLVVNKFSLRHYNTAPDIDPYKMNLIENEVVYQQVGIDKSDVDLAVQLASTVKSREDQSDVNAGVPQKRIIGSSSPYIDPHMPVILKELRASGLFERVDLNNAYADTVLHVSLSREIVGSDFEQFGKVLLMGGSLMCIPVALNSDFLMTVDVEHHSRVIASYRYQAYLHDYVFLLEDPFEDIHEMIEVLLSRFYHDLQKDGVFEKEIVRVEDTES